MVAILTHGEENEILYARDKKYHLEILIKAFAGDNCPSLIGKPKIFIIQVINEAYNIYVLLNYSIAGL